MYETNYVITYKMHHHGFEIVWLNTIYNDLSLTFIVTRENLLLLYQKLKKHICIFHAKSNVQ